MSRYVVQAWSGDDVHEHGHPLHYTPTAPTRTIIDVDPVAVKTGLIDASGREIFRLPDTIKMGFRV